MQKFREERFIYYNSNIIEYIGDVAVSSIEIFLSSYLLYEKYHKIL